MSNDPHIDALLVVPRVRVQNANAISSPMTWGFPAITAFTGLMTAVERKLGMDAGIAFEGVGVVCHAFEPQVTEGGYTKGFKLTRNPVMADGGTAAIVEEGRTHLTVTLVFDVLLSKANIDADARAALAQKVGDLIAGMRVAGGSVLPDEVTPRRRLKPYLTIKPSDDVEQTKWFRRLARQWLPGFVLTGRDDLLQRRFEALKQTDEKSTLLDAWLDLSRLNTRAFKVPALQGSEGTSMDLVEWRRDERQGWLVPIPVGYAALSELKAPGTVAGARDVQTSFRFVESIYSIGQWLSPHRLASADAMLWYPTYDEASGTYRCHTRLTDCNSQTAF